MSAEQRTEVALSNQSPLRTFVATRPTEFPYVPSSANMFLKSGLCAKIMVEIVSNTPSPQTQHRSAKARGQGQRTNFMHPRPTASDSISKQAASMQEPP
mmetsp:Transcript_95601/g.189516  ORF Transcript_95601/g.189516 Transcript_95601/m.189516 type:complete len:99 (-) Transcript_95601:675-971(-)